MLISNIACCKPRIPREHEQSSWTFNEKHKVQRGSVKNYLWNTHWIWVNVCDLLPLRGTLSQTQTGPVNRCVYGGELKRHHPRKEKKHIDNKEDPEPSCSALWTLREVEKLETSSLKEEDCRPQTVCYTFCSSLAFGHNSVIQLYTKSPLPLWNIRLVVKKLTKVSKIVHHKKNKKTLNNKPAVWFKFVCEVKTKQ